MAVSQAGHDISEQNERLLTQKMKLKKKSMYLMHFVQPSTPMVSVFGGCLKPFTEKCLDDARECSARAG